MEKSILLCVVLVAFVTDLTEAEFVTCERAYKKVGCFSDDSVKKLELILTDRDTTSSKDSGHSLDWGRFEASVHSLACRCSAKAKENGYTFFTLRFWAECWAGRDRTYIDDAEKDPKRLSNACANHNFTKCDDKHGKECVGKANSEYIYSLKKTAASAGNKCVKTEGGTAKGACCAFPFVHKTKKYEGCTNVGHIHLWCRTRNGKWGNCLDASVDGGYTAWSAWSSCTVPCGDGLSARERTCTNPEPKGKKGKDCSVLGETTQTKGCILKACPAPPKRWPKGSYGILSKEKCPANWYDFTHCMDTEDASNRDSYRDFHLGLGNLCGKSSITFRYCFKGTGVPSREGGFRTKAAKFGEAYVVRNTETNKESNCKLFGNDGGSVKMDTEDFNNKDTYGNNGPAFNKQKTPLYYPNNFFKDKKHVTLEFCKIGGAAEARKAVPARKAAKAGKAAPATADEMIEVGEFNQKFGLFIRNGHRCPMLNSPYGYLYGTQERIVLDMEDWRNKNSISANAPFVKSGSSDVAVTVCQYDPSKAKKRIYEWPEGTYGILSRLPCPPDWHEFTHCIDTDDSWNVDKYKNFHLGLGKGYCGRTSFALRYCFKGRNVPSRRAIFSNSGSLYVINNVQNGCGTNGGMVNMKAEPSRNLNKFGNDLFNGKYTRNYHPYKFLFSSSKKPDVKLSFCRIGSTSRFMEVGEFGQRFGMFVKRYEPCPVLSSPYGMLKGSKQYLQLDLYRGTNTRGDTPVIIHGRGNLRAWACQYDPQS